MNVRLNDRMNECKWRMQAGQGRAECVCGVVQGCVEIIYIAVQGTLYCFIVYWMCYFQVDAGKPPLQ